MTWKLVISPQLRALCAYARDANFTGSELPPAITPYIPFWRQTGQIIRHPRRRGKEYTYHIARRVLEKYNHDPAWYLAEYKHRKIPATPKKRRTRTHKNRPGQMSLRQWAENTPRRTRPARNAGCSERATS